MNFFQYYINPIKNHYFDFNGRTRRRDYWFFALINAPINIILIATSPFTLGNVMGISILGLIYSLAIFSPSLSLMVRRLHDIGKSGWWALIGFAPIALLSLKHQIDKVSIVSGAFISLIGFVIIIWLIILLATDSQKGSNQYGENPKGE
jgi:uncharacterized membrane protein YhaH (DUF805 family)